MRILYLDLDTLRPDHLGCYGYHRDTSPNIDRIAAEGVRFDQYYCSDAPCLPSRTALMSGRFGIHTGVVNHGGTNADLRIDGPDRGFRDRLNATSLPASLVQAGLHTCFIGGFGDRHASYSFYAGFREIHDTGKGGMESAEEVSPTALEWIRANAKRDNWYLQVNYWDPHTPYRAPEAFGNPFRDDPIPDWITDEVLAGHVRMPGPHTAQDFAMYSNREDPRYPRQPGDVMDRAGLRRMFDGYDCGVRYLDEHIGRLLDALDAEGVLDDLAIIVSSDHGENLGELGMYGEHGTSDAITHRIPMIVRWPGGRRGGVDAGLHYNLDLAPTLADLLAREPKPIWDGRSHAAALRDGTDCGREELVLSQCCHVCQRSVRWNHHLYIRTYHDGFHLWPREMLFDLAADPHEQHNLAPARPELCREAVYRLDRWHEARMMEMSAECATDPLWNVLHEGGPFHAKGHLARYVARLAASGRGDHVEELRRRHPREFR